MRQGTVPQLALRASMRQRMPQGTVPSGALR